MVESSLRSVGRGLRKPSPILNPAFAVQYLIGIGRRTSAFAPSQAGKSTFDASAAYINHARRRIPIRSSVRFTPYATSHGWVWTPRRGYSGATLRSPFRAIRKAHTKSTISVFCFFLLSPSIPTMASNGITDVTPRSPSSGRSEITSLLLSHTRTERNRIRGQKYLFPTPKKGSSPLSCASPPPLKYPPRYSKAERTTVSEGRDSQSPLLYIWGVLQRCFGCLICPPEVLPETGCQK